MFLVVFKIKCNKLCYIQGTLLVTLDKKAFYYNMIDVQNCTLKIIRLMGKSEGRCRLLRISAGLNHGTKKITQ